MLAMPETGLRDVLAHGNPAERVHAAWALGLRSQAASEALIDRADAEPNAGVRRHLVVVLAGLGERDCVRTLAEHDPSDAVRATACVALLRLAHGAPEDETLVLDRLARDPSDEVRIRVIEETAIDELPRTARAIAELLAHSSSEVRHAVAGRVEGGLPIDPGALSRCAIVEPDFGLRCQIARLALRVDPSIAAHVDAETLHSLLPSLFGADERLPRAALDAVLGRWSAGERQLLDGIVVHRLLAAHFDDLSRHTLLQLVAAHPWAMARWDDLLQRCVRTPLEHAERLAIEAIVAELRTAVDEEDEQDIAARRGRPVDALAELVRQSR